MTDVHNQTGKRLNSVDDVAGYYNDYVQDILYDLVKNHLFGDKGLPNDEEEEEEWMEAIGELIAEEGYSNLSELQEEFAKVMGARVERAAA